MKNKDTKKNESFSTGEICFKKFKIGTCVLVSVFIIVMIILYSVFPQKSALGDWLTFGGSLFTFAGTIILALVTIKQNDKLYKQNDELNKQNDKLNNQNFELIKQNNKLLQLQERQFAIISQHSVPRFDLCIRDFDQNTKDYKLFRNQEIFMVHSIVDNVATYILNCNLIGGKVSNVKDIENLHKIRMSMAIKNNSEAIIEGFEINHLILKGAIEIDNEVTWVIEGFRVSGYDIFNLIFDIYYCDTKYITRNNPLTCTLGFTVKTITDIEYSGEITLKANPTAYAVITKLTEKN
ncbi:MAG: hypothetical protein NC131_01330 [Roseburia sp.]|nr:hypothetical protein [Roseburia sp.]